MRCPIGTQARLKATDTRLKMGDIASLPEASMSIEQTRSHKMTE